MGSKTGYKLFSLNSVEKLEEIYSYGERIKWFYFIQMFIFFFFLNFFTLWRLVNTTDTRCQNVL